VAPGRDATLEEAKKRQARRPARRRMGEREVREVEY